MALPLTYVFYDVRIAAVSVLLWLEVKRNTSIGSGAKFLTRQ
jgi:hypothetical protein